MAQVELKSLETGKARFKVEQQKTVASRAALEAMKAATREEQLTGVVSRRTADTRRIALQALVQAGVITQRQAGLLANEARTMQSLVGYEQQIVAGKGEEAAITQRLLLLEQARGAQSSRLAAAGSRVAGLGIGLVGGVIGGAVVSAALLGPLQAAMDAVSNWMQDILDPARHAREALSDVASAVDDIASEDKITRLQAAAKLIDQIGTPRLTPPGGPTTPLTAQALAEAAAVKDLIDNFDLWAKSMENAQNIDALRAEAVRKYTAELLSQSQAYAALEDAVTNAILGGAQVIPPELRSAQAALRAEAEQTAIAFVDARIAASGIASPVDDAAEALRRAQDAAADLRNELIGAAVEAVFDANISTLRAGLESTTSSLRDSAEADIAGIRRAAENAAEGIRNGADRRIDALQKQLGNLELTPSGRTKALERQLDALKDSGPSRQTKELADQIERLNRAQEKAAYRQSLADVAEERHQILLRERLRLTKAQINLDDYKGADRLIAIDALLTRMQKQNEAQDRFNKLLDIQYQMQQGVRRAQGETIRDFTERRAQYYRGLLQQAAELNRAGPQEELEAERDRVQTSIDLKELEQKRRKIIEDRARVLYMRSLQEQLQASQERDRKELESRREALQKQLEASKKADQAALESRREALRAQIEAVRQNAADTIQKIEATRDREIAAREAARDSAIEAAQVAAEKAIAAEQARSEAIKRLSNQTEADRLTLALKGARDMAELQWFAGQLAGSQYAVAFLLSSGQFYTMDPIVRAQILNNLFRAVTAYSQRLKELQPDTTGFLVPRTGFAEGGVFRLNNTNTPLGQRDVRWGDGQGDELGVVLSNRVVQTLREQGGSAAQALMGDVTFVSEDPYRDRYKFERMVRNVQNREFN
jgi:hypothetical protein